MLPARPIARSPWACRWVRVRHVPPKDGRCERRFGGIPYRNEAGPRSAHTSAYILAHILAQILALIDRPAIRNMRRRGACRIGMGSACDDVSGGA